jgi:hypothetical protein
VLTARFATVAGLLNAFVQCSGSELVSIERDVLFITNLDSYTCKMTARKQRNVDWECSVEQSGTNSV